MGWPLWSPSNLARNTKKARWMGHAAFIPRRSACAVDDYYELSRRSTALLFAVELLHLHGVVAGSGNGFSGDGRFEFCNLLSGEFHVERAPRASGDLGTGAGADYRNQRRTFGQHPGDGQLRRRDASGCSDHAKPSGKLLVGGVVFSFEAWAGAHGGRRPRAGCDPESRPRESGTIRGGRDAQFVE